MTRNNTEQVATANPMAYARASMRRQAEEVVRENMRQLPENLEVLTTEEALVILHELRVHQLELEMQNEELRINQVALEASNKRYYDFYNLAPVGYLTLSPQGLIVEVNLPFATLLGVTRASIVNEPLTRFILPEDQDGYYLYFKSLAAPIESAPCELRLQNKNGEPVWVRIEATLALDIDGTMGVRAVVSEITESKRSADAIQASQTRYQTLMEQSFEALAVVDIQTQEVVEVNRRFTDMFGYSLTDDAPLFVEKFMVDSPGNLARIFNTTLNQQRYLPTESRIIRRKNGSEMPVERAGTVIEIEGREYLLASLRDMTAERRRQAELIRDVELARRVQYELLPQLPASSFVTVRTFYHPSNVVSGDSYFLEWRNEGELLRGFLVDITGHGLGTAIQTSSFNVLLREESIARLPLHEQLQWLNARAAKYFAEGSFAAVLGFELDLSLRELRYVGAGITQFYVNGKKIEAPGMFIGIWNDVNFDTGIFPVSAGDSFCFLTDGFTDVMAQPENAEVWAAVGQSFDAHVASLAKLVESGNLRDDATGICLKVKEFR